ncbi:MAG: type II CAAX endopeptidase family protein [Spirochaetia bacterium]
MKKSRALAEMVLLFSAFFLPGYAAQGFFAAVGPATDLLMLQSIITGIPQFLLMAYVAIYAGSTPPARWGFVTFEARDALRSALLLLGCFAVLVPFVVLLVALPPDVRRSLVQGYRWGLTGAPQIPLALLFGLTAGYREEFFFRSYLLGRLEEVGIQIPIAVAASTALFCVGHVYEGPLAVAITAGLGVLLCAAWLRRRSLHVVAIAHGAYNTVVLCLGLVLPRALPDASVMRIFGLQ